MVKWIEILKEDVNQEDGYIITLFTKMTNVLFIGAILFALPIYLYFQFSFL